jgi:hypothetical protein
VFFSCRESEQATPVFVPNTGQIQILNGCGFARAAENMRDFLSEKGFDVIEFGNAPYWNFTQTIVVARSENLKVARDLAKILGTENLIQLKDSTYIVDATVFVGKDFYRLTHKGTGANIEGN